MDLKDLQTQCNVALVDASVAYQVDHSIFAGDAINWADLKCNEALHCRDQDGTESYRVFIDEASPTCDRLRGFVLKKLLEHFGAGTCSIYVETEW